jgi:chemotaxis protein histidine kinase CheA
LISAVTNRLLSATKNLLDVDLRFCDIEKEMGPNLIDAIKARAKEGYAPLREVHLDGNFLSSNDLKEILSLLAVPAKSSNRVSLTERTPSSTSADKLSGASNAAATDAHVKQLQTKLQAERRRAEEAQKEEARLRERLAKVEEELSKKALEEKKKHKDEAKKSKITINTKNLKIMDRLYTSGSGAQIYSCLVDGWQCAMKELVVDPLVPDHVILSFETEIAIAERLPYHPHVIVRPPKAILSFPLESRC